MKSGFGHQHRSHYDMFASLVGGCQGQWKSVYRHIFARDRELVWASGCGLLEAETQMSIKDQEEQPRPTFGVDITVESRFLCSFSHNLRKNGNLQRRLAMRRK